jgi:ribonuclease HI
MVESLKSSYPLSSNDTMENNHTGVILNVDGSCLGSPTRTGYIGILRNDAGFYLSGFSGYLHDSSNILYAELYAMISGLSLANEKGIVNLICYSDSLLCTNIITGPILKFHIYAV